MPSLDTVATLKPKRYFELVGGVQYNTSEIISTNSEFEELINIDTTKIGALQKAPFQTQFGPQMSATSTVNGSTVFEDSSKVGHRLAVVDNAGATHGTIVEQTSGSTTPKYSLLTAGTKTEFAQTFGYLFATNKTDGLISTNDLSTWGTVNCVNAPKCDFVVEYNRYLYLFGDPNHPQRVYRGFIQDPNVTPVAFVLHDQSGTLTTIGVDDSRYIQPGMVMDIVTHGTSTVAYTVTVLTVPNRTSFTVASASFTLSDTDEIYLTGTKTGNIISILWDPAHDYFETPAKGEVIIMGVVSNNRLILCTENATYRYDGSGLVTVDPTIGASHRQPASIGRFTFWLHKGIVYRYDGYVPVPISDSIRPLLLSISDYSICRAIPDKTGSRLFLYIGTTTFGRLTQTDVWAVYSVFSDKWEFRTDMNCVSGFVDATGNGLPAMISCTSDGKMFQIDLGTTAEFYSAKTKFDAQDNPEMLKQYRYVTVVSTSPGGNIAFSVDFQRDNYISIGQITDRIQTFELPNDTNGNFFSLQWTDNQDGDGPNFLGYTVWYQETGLVIPDR